MAMMSLDVLCIYLLKLDMEMLMQHTPKYTEEEGNYDVFLSGSQLKYEDLPSAWSPPALS